MRNLICIGAGLIVLVVVFGIDPTGGVCNCTMDYKPVCGSNNRNYTNECQLNCEKANFPGLKVAHNGSCTNGSIANIHAHAGSGINAGGSVMTFVGVATLAILCFE